MAPEGPGAQPSGTGQDGDSLSTPPGPKVTGLGTTGASSWRGNQSSPWRPCAGQGPARFPVRQGPACRARGPQPPRRCLRDARQSRGSAHRESLRTAATSKAARGGPWPAQQPLGLQQKERSVSQGAQPDRPRAVCPALFRLCLQRGGGRGEGGGREGRGPEGGAPSPGQPTSMGCPGRALGGRPCSWVGVGRTR